MARYPFLYRTQSGKYPSLKLLDELNLLSEPVMEKFTAKMTVDFPISYHDGLIIVGSPVYKVAGIQRKLIKRYTNIHCLNKRAKQRKANYKKLRREILYQYDLEVHELNQLMAEANSRNYPK